MRRHRLRNASRPGPVGAQCTRKRRAEANDDRENASEKFQGRTGGREDFPIFLTIRLRDVKSTLFPVSNGRKAPTPGRFPGDRVYRPEWTRQNPASTRLRTPHGATILTKRAFPPAPPPPPSGMKFIPDPIVKTSREVTALASRLLDEGLAFLKASFGAIPVFASTRPYIATDDFHADETHYFLIPFRLADDHYAIGTTRVLPEGIGPDNDLPKRRVFHLPNLAARDTIEELLERQIASGRLASEAGASDGDDLAARLDRIAVEIDRKSNLVTGGLLVIGGAVALANPLVGAGIAAKALFPSVGAILSREGLRHLGQRLRRGRENRRIREAEKSAEQEVERLSPLLHENPLLRLLEEALATTDPEHDPASAFARLPMDVASLRVTSLTAGTITHCYRATLDSPDDWPRACLHPNDVRWLRSLADFEIPRNTSGS